MFNKIVQYNYGLLRCITISNQSKPMDGFTMFIKYLKINFKILAESNANLLRIKLKNIHIYKEINKE